MERGLYQWQEECLRQWFANGGRGMVEAVTGSGKTLLALTAAKRLEEELNREVRVKIVVPTGTLLRQWDRALREFLSQSRGGEGAHEISRGEVGLCGGGHRTASDCKYMIYVVNSARYELARRILSQLRAGETVFLIADECHHYESGQNRLIFEFLPYIEPYEKRFFSLGLSATLPSGQAGNYLASVLGRKIYSYGMKRALAMQTVCRYDIYHISLAFTGEEREEYEELTDRMSALYSRLLQRYPFLKDMENRERYEMLGRLADDKNRRVAEAASGYMKLSFRRKNLVCLASARIAGAFELIERLDPEEKILVFGERIRQTEELYGLLQERYPGRTGRYHSQMGPQANRNVLERFRTGEIRILITCRAVDEGMDVPETAVGIILSGTSTQRQRVQRLGRIIRRREDKDRAVLYYLHIAETSEDACFLPDAEESRVTELEYLSDARDFFHPVYSGKAGRLLREMQEAGLDSEKIREAERCLRLGCVRPDWMLPGEEVCRKMREAKYIGDRNYWVCMKKLQDMGE